jgi:hypothetical protein
LDDFYRATRRTRCPVRGGFCVMKPSPLEDIDREGASRISGVERLADLVRLLMQGPGVRGR